MQKRSIGNFLLVLTFFTLLLPFTIAAESAVNKPTVYLNHLYTTLDSTTFQAVNNSDFLKMFGNCLTSTVKADSTETWTGFYIFGKKTYLEFFSADKIDDIGVSGIGFGVEKENDLDLLYDYCLDLNIEIAAKEIRHRDVGGEKIPWFSYMNIEKYDTTVSSIMGAWVMEYEREYLKIKFPDISPDSLKITRDFYLQDDFRSDLLFKNVIEIELAIGESDMTKFTNELKLFGYSLESKDDLINAIGPEIRILYRLRSDSLAGVYRIKFSLTDKPYEPQTVQFGNKSKLVLNADKTAEWFIGI